MTRTSMKRRLISYLLILTMLFSLLPVSAFAEGDAPAVPDETEQTQTVQPDAPEQPEAPDAPEQPEAPDEPEQPEQPDEPETSDEPEQPDDNADNNIVGNNAAAQSDEPYDSGTCGDDLRWTMTEDGALTISGTGAMTNWSEDEPSAWYTSDRLTSITINPGVTSIGNYAFYFCQNLRSVQIPESVTSIGSHAFELCQSLQSITLSEGLAAIGDYAFRYCALYLIIIPASVSSIGVMAFDCPCNVSYQNPTYSDYYGVLFNADGTTLIHYPSNMYGGEYSVPNGVIAIADNAFNSTPLTSIEIPATVTSIGSDAFSYSMSLTQLKFKGSAPSFGSNAFGGITDFTVYYLENDATWTDAVKQNYGGEPEWEAYAPADLGSGECGDNLTWTLNELGELTISGTGAMTEWASSGEESPWVNNEAIISVTIESGVTSIGSSSFVNCTGIVSVNIANTVTSIGNGAFPRCENLEEIVIPSSVTSIGSYAFSYCKRLPKVDIPNGVQTIGLRAFDRCYGMEYASIPASVTSIGEHAFICPMNVNASNSKYSSVDGVLFNKAKTSILIYPYEKTDTSYSIPSSVTTIGACAFADCSTLTRITIPSGVSSIGNYAFSGCSGLTSIELPSGVSSIGSGAFISCLGLTRVSLPSGVTEVGPDTFNICTALESIVIPDSVTRIGDGAFAVCDSLESISIPSGVTYIGDMAFSSCGNLRQIKFTGSAPEIANSAFSELGTEYAVEVLYPDTDASWTDEVKLPYGGNADSITWQSYHPESFATSGTCGDNLTWELVGNVLTISGTGAMTDYNIRNMPPWWKNESLHSVIIKSGVTSIGTRAFEYSLNLTSVTIPSSVKTIGNHAFYLCESLAGVDIPSSVTSIGIYAFYDCKSLSRVNISNGVKSIGDCAFALCGQLTNLDIPASVTSIEDGAFICSANVAPSNPSYSSADGVLFNKAKTSLLNYPMRKAGSSYSVPDSVTYIAPEAFAGSELTSIELPSNLTSIGNSTFYCCEGLTSLVIPDSVTSIGDDAFFRCEALTGIELPASLTSIGDNAFSGCEAFTTIELPAGVTSIGSSAFSSCHNLHEIRFLGPVPTLSEDAFTGVTATVRYPSDEPSWTEDVMQNYGGNLTWECYFRQRGTCGDDLTWVLDEEGVLTISGTGDMTDWDYNTPWQSNENIRAVIINPGVTSIGNYAFYQLSNLERITIPSSVTSIGDFALSECGLTSVDIPASVTCIGDNAFDCPVNVSPESDTFSSIDGILFNKAKTELLRYPILKPETEYSIPDGVISICYGAFCNCTALTSIEMPSSVTNIDSRAFSGCTGLTSIEIPKGVTSIGDFAFCGCTGLTSIEIPEGVTSIDRSVFNSCTNLTSIIIPNSITSIPDGFAYQTALTSIEIPEGVTSIGEEAFGRCSSLTSVDIPAGVIFIGEYAFNQCGLESVDIPASVTYIGNYAFDCPVNIAPENKNYSSIDGVLFNKAKTELIRYSSHKTDTAYSIPDTVTVIGPYAFSPNTALISISIPSSVRSIGGHAFCGCNIASIEIPESVTFIGDSAFFGCYNLSNIKFLGSAPTLGNEIFYSVTAASATYPGNDPSWTEDVMQSCGGEITWSSYIRAYGSCGDNVTWALGTDNVLTISGTGAMQNWPDDARPEWFNGDFYDYDIQAVIIKSGVTSIGDNAFKNLAVLEDVSIPSSVKSIGAYAFSGCAALSDIVLPSGITTIKTGAFAECTAINSINVPVSVTEIGGGAFPCPVEVAAENGIFSSVDGVLFSKAKTTLINYPSNSMSSTYSIPETVATIAESAFYGSHNLTSVTIPEGVTTIGAKAFGHCSGLTSVHLPSSVRSIGHSAFFESFHLTDINIPEGVTAIGNNTFYGCSALVSIDLPASLASIGSNAFYACNELSSIKFKGSAPTIDPEAFAGVTIKAYYPGSDPTWTEEVRQSYGGISEWADYITAYGSCGPRLTWTLDESGVLTISGVGSMYNYSISDEPEWYDNNESIVSVVIMPGVANIGDFALGGLPNLRSVTIPSSVKTIGHSAFHDCTALTGVVIPSGVTTIGNYAFNVCDALTSVDIPASVTTMWEGSFNCKVNVDPENSNYSSVDGVLFNKAKTELLHYPVNKTDSTYSVPDTVTAIGRYAFRFCASLTSVELPDGITSIPEGAFANCTGLTGIVIPDGVVSIESTAFLGCNNLMSAEIPDSVTFIGHDAFGGCALTSIRIPDGVTTLTAGVFGHNRFTSIEIPSSVTSVGMLAFGDCELLTEIKFRGSAPTFDEGVFSGVTATVYYNGSDPTWTEEVRQQYGGNITWESYVRASGACGSKLTWALYNDGVLAISGTGAMQDWALPDKPAWADNAAGISSVIIGSGVTSIGDYAFTGLTALTSVSIPASVNSIGSYAFSDCTALSVIELPSGVTAIKNYAFKGCRTESIDIPATVTEIGTGAFSCPINVAPENNSYSSVGGVLFSKNGAVLISYPADSQESSYSIPEGVTAIGDGAFSGCGYLRDVMIPDSVTSIGSGAFQACGNLASVDIPSSVKTLGVYAFANCTALTSAELHEGLVSIGNCAFNGCSSLSSISIPSSVTTIGDYAFYECGFMSGTYIDIPASVSSIGVMAFNGPLNVSTGNLTYSSEGGVLFSKDGTQLLYHPKNTGVTVYFVPDGVKSIAPCAFSNCTSLMSVVLHEGVTTIGNEAFSSCTGLTRIEIPASVASIGSFAFGRCEALRSIKFIGAAPTIGEQAFGSVEAEALYPDCEASWAALVGKNYGGSITWSPYTPTAGKCGDNISYTIELNYDGVYELTLDGSGATYSYEAGKAPWYGMRDEIQQISINCSDPSKLISSIGSNAFYGLDNVTAVSWYRPAYESIEIAAGNDVLMQPPRFISHIVADGPAGDSLTYIASSDGVDVQLSFSGSGRMNDYELGQAPWYEYRNNVRSVSFFEDDPASPITYIGMNAFYGFGELSVYANRLSWESMIIADGNDALVNSGFTAATKVVKAGSVGSGITYEIISDGVDAILCFSGSGAMPDYAAGAAPWYEYRESIKQVSMGDYGSNDVISYIGAYAFYNCTGISSIGVDAEEIGPSAFRGCTGLTDVIFFNTVTIGENAFLDCNALESVSSVYTRDEMTIGAGNEALDGLEFIKIAKTLDSGITGNVSWYYYEDNSLYVCSYIGGSGIPNFDTASAAPWYIYKDELKYFNISDSITKIGNNAFGDYPNIISVTYHGTAAQWAELPIGSGNGALRRARVFFPNDPTMNTGLTALSETELQISGSGTATLKVALDPNPYKTSVVWSISAQDKQYAAIGSVGSSCIVAAKSVTAPHTVTVTASAKDGSALPVEFHITILPKPTSVALMLDGQNMAGKILSVDPHDVSELSFSSVVNPDGAPQDVTWSSSSRLITVEDGVVTIPEDTRTGTSAVISVSTVGSTVKTAKVTIKIVKAVHALEMPTEKILASGKSLTLKPVFTPADASNKTLIWTLDCPSTVATVSSVGVVTAKTVTEPTTVNVTATSSQNPEVSAVCAITIYPAVTGIALSNGDAVLTGKTVNIDLGEETRMQLTAVTAPEAAYKAVTWKTNNKLVTVDEDGMVLFDPSIKTGTSITVTATAADGSGRSSSVTFKIVSFVKEIEISGDSVVGSGRSRTLKASITPADATTKTLVWTSSDPTVATVSTSGLVSAKTVTEPKSVTITATAKDRGTVLADFTMTVYPVVTGITVNDGEETVSGKTLTIDLSEGAVKRLTAVTAPEAAYKPVTWKTNNKLVTVDEDGTVRFDPSIKLGTSITVTATAADGSGKSANVIFKTVSYVKDIEIAGDSVVGSGRSRTHKATIAPANATTKTLVWTSSDPTVAAVSTSGVVSAKTVTEPKSVTITATAKDRGTVFAEFPMTVYPVVTGITVSEGEDALTGKTVNVDLSEGLEKQLTAVTAPEAAYKPVTWKTNNKLVTVDEDGTVRFDPSIKLGTSITVTATAADGSGKAANVIFKTVSFVKSIEISGDSVVGSGRSKTLKATIAPANATTKTLVWTSSDPTVAAVSTSGVVSAKTVTEPKSVTITATAKDRNTVYAEFDMTVYPVVTGISVANGDTVVTGKTLTIDLAEDTQARLTAVTAPEAAYKPVTWKTNNKLVTVNEDGLVCFDPSIKTGTSITVTATAADGSGKSANVIFKTVSYVKHLEITGNDVIASGKSLTLKTVITPANATSKALTWKSSDPTVATVSSTGVVAAKAVTEPSTVIITATANDRGLIYAGYVVTVYPAVTGIQLSEDGNAITSGATLEADINNEPIRVLTADTMPEAACKDIIWKSSSSLVNVYDGIVAFDPSIKNGTTVTITATAADSSGKSANVKFKVVRSVEYIELPEENMGIAAGKSITLKPIINNGDPNGPTNAKLIWSVDCPSSVATISSTGVLKAGASAVGESFTVTCTAADTTNEYRGDCRLTDSKTYTIYPAATKVYILNEDEDVSGKTLSLDMTYMDMVILTTQLEPDTAFQGVTWKSSNNLVTIDNIVDAYGTVTGALLSFNEKISTGTTVTITATAADGSARTNTTRITIKRSVADIVLNDNAILASGRSMTLKPTILPANATNKALQWSSDDPTVASVSSSGIVSAKTVKEPTTVTISCTTKDGSEITRCCTFTVYPATTAINIYQGSKKVTGSTLTVTSQRLYLSALTAPDNCCPLIDWSSNNALVTVDEEGAVTIDPSIKAGTIVTLTAKTVDGTGKTAAVKLKMGKISPDLRVLKVAFNQTITNPEATTLKWISDQLMERTNGRYALEIYPDAQLGDQAQTLEQVVMGTLDMALVGNAVVESYCPDFAILGTPYVYDSIEHQQKVFESGKLADLYATTVPQGFTVLSSYCLGSRNIYTRDRAIVEPSDAKGMKIRVNGLNSYIEMMNTITGGNAVTMGLGDVYSAIQAGTLDGAENNIITYVDLVQYEVAKYYNLTGHLMVPDELCIANDVLNAMSAEDQQTLKDICNESIPYMFNLAAELRADYEAKAVEQGVTITQSNVAAFQELCQGVIQNSANKSDLSKAVYDAILSER